MEKFFNLMYDFFAFAFPGACIIGSVLLLGIDQALPNQQINTFTYFLLGANKVFLFNQLPRILTSNFSHFLLALAFAGYIIGYTIKPIARYILLIHFSTFIFGRFFPFLRICRFKKLKYNKKYIKLKKQLMISNRSKEFIKIRELAPRIAQYIEFWDMHITMSHNLAFACLVFMFVQGTNLLKSQVISLWPMIYLFIALLIAFFTLLKISLSFSFWWINDIKDACKFIDENKLAKKSCCM